MDQGRRGRSAGDVDGAIPYALGNVLFPVRVTRGHSRLRSPVWLVPSSFGELPCPHPPRPSATGQRQGGF